MLGLLDGRGASRIASQRWMVDANPQSIMGLACFSKPMVGAGAQAGQLKAHKARMAFVP